MSQKVENPKWWQYLARFLLGLTVFTVCVCTYNVLALKTFGRNDGLGYFLGYGVFSAFSFLILLGTTLLATVGLIAGFLLKYSLKLYVIILAISLPLIFYFENTF